MTDKEKKIFAEMAEKDKVRYDREMASYTPPAGEGGGRKRRRKDPNEPKRPLSTFFLFCHDERPCVRRIYPSYSVCEVAKELGERWSKVTAEVKQKYELQADSDKKRYEIEMENYRNTIKSQSPNGKVLMEISQSDLAAMTIEEIYEICSQIKIENR
jgi:hypothetical protein